MTTPFQRIKNNFPDAHIIDANHIDTLHDMIPDSWIDIISSPRKLWTTKILDLWHLFKQQLPTFINQLEDRLREVIFFKSDNKYFIGYLVPFNGRDYLYVVGNPLETDRTAMAMIPKDFSDFYEILHDGFVFMSGYSGGPLPSRDFFKLNEYDWGFVEDNKNAFRNFNLAHFFAVFSNGGGGHLCIDIVHPKNVDNGIDWFDNDMPFEEPFWPLLDAWMEIGITG